MISIDINGRIDELEDINTPDKLYQYLCEVAGVQILSPKEEHPQTPGSSVTYGIVGEQLNHGAPCYSVEDFYRLRKMFDPLNLPPGTYMVTGIEGKFYDGYVSGRRYIDEPSDGPPPAWPAKPGDTEVTIEVPRSNWVDDAANDAPWPLADVRPEYSAFDIMLLVASSEANGYPDVNHVWFETLDIDPVAKTINFGMGS